ncbi:NisI/SpaI family lantibiotic immunity lipoprotein [Paenibacillus wynnii]|uniref:NisI/SpaI family lantibiotic immunity lipoprotein n=1 Tax=Paenibacillus wynnii TaxID=268407 RepID=UPI00278CB1C6|nr:NisI/SpaI family lantibiotic immunity lipoprotein [Paenibacillus wynnii]MDQ0194907.1 hypothetical protein [Paenibacillus wynnii]
MKHLFGIIIFLIVIISGCSNEEATENPLLPYPQVVVWDKKAYVVTNEIVAQVDIGQKLGEVKRYIDPNKSLPEKNEDSTIAPVGSKLYEIKNSDLKQEFAVEINGQLRKAIYNAP